MDNHFIVPLTMWKDYYKKFKRRVIHRSGILYYNPADTKDYNWWLEKHISTNSKIQVLTTNVKFLIFVDAINFNQVKLDMTLSSISMQTYKNYKVFVFYNNTLEINKNYSKFLVYGMEDMLEIINKVSYENKNNYISILTAGDLYEQYTLNLVVRTVNKNSDIALIYGDEDDICGEYKINPLFKPDYSPDTLLSYNYIGDAVFYKSNLISELGGLDKNLGKSALYDMGLKIFSQNYIVEHIPSIIFHKGDYSKRVKSEIKLVNRFFKTNNIDADASTNGSKEYMLIHYKLKETPLVSIIIPTRDYSEITRNCITSLYEKTQYHNYEIIIVDNGSVEEKTIKLFEEFKQKYNNFRIIRDDGDFNFSRLNNLAVKISKGSVLVLLNNDTEIISGNWLNILVGYALQPHIGAVGPKLLYKDNTVQHGGIILGLGDVAAHAYLNASDDENGYMYQLKSSHDCAAVTAACLVIEKKKYLECGMLNEKLKVAYNDVELNIKLLKLGYYNVLVPEIKIYHLESKSRGLDTTTEKYKLLQRERDYMYSNYTEFIKRDPYYNDNFTKLEFDSNFLLKEIEE